MPSAIVDTNVLISSIISRGYPHQILFDQFLDGKFELFISNELLNEYFSVLQRPKFLKYPDFVRRAEFLVERIQRKATMFEPDVTVKEIHDDADNRLLELALVSKADFIVTGNFNDFTFTSFGKTKVIDPKSFWNEMEAHTSQF
jgi:uncharacterized protein